MAVLAGSESYDSNKIGFADTIRDINDIIKEGHVEIQFGKKIPVEIFLGDDYKVRNKKSDIDLWFYCNWLIITAES